MKMTLYPWHFFDKASVAFTKLLSGLAPVYKEVGAGPLRQNNRRGTTCFGR